MYIVLELQTTNGVTAIVPPASYDNINAAYQKYYTGLAAAAVSAVPVHTMMLINEFGNLIRVEYFEHPVEEEPEEPETPSEE